MEPTRPGGVGTARAAGWEKAAILATMLSMKMEVYRWHLSSQLKSELEEAARAKQKTLAELLEQMANDWLGRFRTPEESEEERQTRLHEAAMSCAGIIHGDDPNRAQNARALVREKIARR
ncbi:MAG TPA: hypothetical protein VGP73_08435 [Thermoanaerobaculia bacterium]